MSNSTRVFQNTSEPFPFMIYPSLWSELSLTLRVPLVLQEGSGLQVDNCEQVKMYTQTHKKVLIKDVNLNLVLVCCRYPPYRYLRILHFSLNVSFLEFCLGSSSPFGKAQNSSRSLMIFPGLYGCFAYCSAFQMTQPQYLVD